MIQPRTRITLDKAQNGDDVIYVTESASVVRGTVNAAIEGQRPQRLVTFARVLGQRTASFSSQAGNIVNVEDVTV